MNEHKMITIGVGSTNPAKIEAVKQGFNRVWPDPPAGGIWEVIPVAVDSGISAQPMSDEESIRGARQRAAAALAACPQADYGVGLEGGLQLIGNDWFDCGWVVVIDKTQVIGIGSTARVVTPPKMMALIHSGMELGEAVDQIFGTVNAKQGDGHFGLMTRNAITRTSGYADGVVMALARFIHPDLF